MTYYSRTIGRMVVEAAAPPAWRQAMTLTNTVYEVGYAWNDATHGLVAKYVWPEPTKGGFPYSGTDGAESPIHAGYGGSVFVPEIGAFGSMVFGGTGEGGIAEQLSVFPLSDNAPEWQMFQQPLYPTSLSEANTTDADWYYNPTEYAALPAPKKIDQVGQAIFYSTWDRTFPIGFFGWIGRRKMRASIIGNSRPHFFRYEMPVYIPAAMTGTGAGAIVVNSRGTIYGPFAQGPKPYLMPDADWFEDVWPSGRRKHYIWAMNVQTKVWQRLATPIPDFTGGDANNIMHPHGVVDRANKRVYYSTAVGSDGATYYADFAAGLAGMTWVGPTLQTPVNATDITTSSNRVLCVPASGALAGKRLWLFKDAVSAGLGMFDLDTNTYRRLQITGLPASTDWWIFSYDAVLNRVYIHTKHSSYGIRSYRFTIPDNYTSAAAYSVTMTALSLASGVVMESVADSTPWQYNERASYHPTLGTIMFTQRFGKMLAYVPA